MERRWEKATGGLRSLGGKDIMPIGSDQKYPCRRGELERREMGIWLTQKERVMEGFEVPVPAKC